MDQISTKAEAYQGRAEKVSKVSNMGDVKPVAVFQIDKGS